MPNLKEIVFGQMTDDQLRTQVKGVLGALIFVDPAAVANKFEEVESMQREGLLKLMEIFAEGFNKQHNWFQVLGSRDHKFSSQLAVTLYQDEMKRI
jgi:hypothetical protein